MAMGRRKQQRQQDLWVATSDVVETPANAFYDRLNQILDEHKFDLKVERLCQKFYKKSPYGRPSLAPGVYFRSLLIGYFEGLDSVVPRTSKGGAVLEMGVGPLRSAYRGGSQTAGCC